MWEEENSESESEEPEAEEKTQKVTTFAKRWVGRFKKKAAKKVEKAGQQQNPAELSFRPKKALLAPSRVRSHRIRYSKWVGNHSSHRVSSFQFSQ